MKEITYRNWQSKIKDIAKELDELLNHVEIIEIPKKVYVELKTTMFLKGLEEELHVHGVPTETKNGTYLLVIVK